MNATVYSLEFQIRHLLFRYNQFINKSFFQNNFCFFKALIRFSFFDINVLDVVPSRLRFQLDVATL